MYCLLLNCMHNNYTVPDSPPSNVTATALSSNQIFVTWDMVPPIDQNGVITMYQVFYYSMDTPNELITKNVTGLEVNLTGLEKSVNYSISVCAYTSHGRGPYSESTWATTNSGMYVTS